MSGGRVLVVGGTGAFGRRLVHGLLATTEAAVVIAGRNLDACARLADDLRRQFPGREMEAARLDRDSAAAADIAGIDPTVVVDAAGPFQGDDLRFARAVIAAGRFYVDLADARDFVARFEDLDAEAEAAGVLAVTGASSTPALSNAALDALVAGWQSVEAVEVAISPGNRAPRGLSVVRAILSYAGRPVRTLRDGRWIDAAGWGWPVRRRLPGLGPRLLSLCETPDLDLIPKRRPGVQTVTFRAGLELSSLHLGLCLLGSLKRAGLVRDLGRLAEPLRRVASAFERFGSDRGGMTVDATGVDRDGRPARAVWSLVAEAGDGPSVPTLPALAIVRAMLDGRPPAGPGARSAAGLIDLADFEREAERLAISTRIARSSPGAEPLFRTALGAAFDDLPPVVREAHDPRPTIYLEGVADIHGPQGALAALIGRAIGFPRGLRSAPARVRIERMGGGERWTRRFAGSTFSSRLSPGSAPGTLIERFGPFSFDLAIAAEAGGFTLGGRGVALPRNGVATAARALDGRAGLRDARWRIRLQRPHRRAVRRPHRALRGPA